MLFTTLALGLIAGFLEVDGAATCPSPIEVGERLAILLPVGVAPGSPSSIDHARINVFDGSLVIDLEASSGLRSVRRLAANAPCGELADAAAVIIASLETQFRPELQPFLVMPTPPPLPPPLPSAPPPPTGMPPSPAPASPTLAVTAAGPVSRLRWDVAAGFAGAVAGPSFAPGGTIEATIGRAATGFGGWASLVGVGTSNLPLGPGQAAWTRPSLSVGAGYRLTRSRWTFDVHADAVAALLVVNGKGFTVTRQQYDFDPGLGGGVRAAVHVGATALFLGARAVGWLREQRVFVDGLAAAAVLPRYEVLLTLGLGRGRFD